MAAVFALLLLIATAQTFSSGYVDPEPILEAAIGVDALRCVLTSSGRFSIAMGSSSPWIQSGDVREATASVSNGKGAEAESLVVPLHVVAQRLEVEVRDRSFRPLIFDAVATERTNLERVNSDIALGGNARDLR